MASILEGIEADRVKTFRKEWNELERILALLNAEGVKKSPAFHALSESVKRVIKLWNKKYKAASLGLSDKPPYHLNLFIKIKTVKEAFLTAAKMEGLSSLGRDGFGKVKITETDSVAGEIEGIQDNVFLTFGDKAPTRLSLKKGKKGVAVEGDSNGFEGPRTQLLAYYALMGRAEKIKILPEIQGIGHSSTPTLDEEREFYRQFNPKMDNI